MLTVETAKEWLKRFHDDIQQHQQALNELDTAIGDGDHGSNMARGMQKVTEALEEASFDTVSEVFKTVAMTLLSQVGGASGPLYGSAFLAMAKTAQTTTDKEALVASALDSLSKRGQAKVGEKTMVDVWSAVLSDLQNDQASPQKIDAYVKASADLVATKGRASYVGERSKGHVDPGSCSSGYLLKCLLEV